MYKEGGHELLLSPSCLLLFLLSLLNGSGPCDKLGLISCWFCCSSFILSHPLSLSLWFTLYCRIAAFMIDYWLELSDTHARMRASHTWTCHDMRNPENTWVMIDFTLGFLDDRSFFFFLHSYFTSSPTFSALLSRIFAFRDSFICNWSLRLSFFNWTRIVFELPG